MVSKLLFSIIKSTAKTLSNLGENCTPENNRTSLQKKTKSEQKTLSYFSTNFHDVDIVVTL